MTDEDYDKIVRHINKALTLGWNPSTNAWGALGIAITKRQEARDQPIWGIRETYLQRDTQNGGTQTSMRVSMVANAWAFHPLATPIRDVTYDEAIALHKLKN
jgi:hypothetical protein